jgi:molybdopterin/thiamine biosynthesis adenylyltransferase
MSSDDMNVDGAGRADEWIQWSHLSYTFGREAIVENGRKVLVVGRDDAGRSAVVVAIENCGVEVDATSDFVAAGYDCVVCTLADMDEAASLDSVCRVTIPRPSFLWARLAKNLLTLFRSSPPSNGINPEGFCRKDGHIVKIGHENKVEEPRLLTCVIRHGLDTGDVVRIGDSEFTADVVSETEFHAKAAKEGGKNTSLVGETVKLVMRKEEESGIEEQDIDLSSALLNTKLSSSTSVDSSNLSNPGFLSGIVASQVVNIVTKRFRAPVNQWIHLDVPTAPESTTKTKLSVLLTGANGPIGITIAEHLIKSGVASTLFVAGGADEIVNPSLLRNGLRIVKEGDVGKKIGEVIKANSSIPVTSLPFISGETERSHFGDAFFQKVDVIISAGGSWDERRNVGSLSVQHRKALIDVGSDHFVGHVQTVIPGVTESYCCSQDPSDSNSDLPYCVLKSFPYAAEHAVTWAAAKVETLIERKPEKYNEFWVEEDLIERVERGDLPETSCLANKFLSSWICSTWPDCVAFARNKFEKYFKHKAMQLVVNFPEDCQTSSGGLFWSFPKRLPRPVSFDVDDPLHFRFVSDLARTWAIVCKVPFTDSDLSRISSLLPSIAVAPFVASANKKIVTDEAVTRVEIESGNIGSGLGGDVSESLAAKLRAAKCRHLDPSSVPSSLASSLLGSCSRLRCLMYGISPTPDDADVRMFAEKICPCPAPVAEVLADLALSELLRLRSATGQSNTTGSGRSNWWISLLPELEVVRSDPRPVPVTIIPGGKGLSFSLWDQFEVVGSATWKLQDFLDSLSSQFAIRATMVVQGTKMVYVKIMPTHKNRKTKIMSSLIRKDPGSDFAILSITMESDNPDEDAEDLSAPPIKYYWDGKKDT